VWLNCRALSNQASPKAPGGTWERLLNLLRQGSREPQVAMNDSGQAIAVWAQRTERATSWQPANSQGLGASLKNSPLPRGLETWMSQ